MAIRVNTAEFNRTLQTYVRFSRRDWQDIFNTKGFFIARRATVETKKADAGQIRSLRERSIIGTATRNGRIRTVRDVLSNTRAANIIQARRLAAGQPPLSPSELPAAIRAFISARLRSIAYIKSGWIPAIRALAPLAVAGGGGRPRQDNTARIQGRPKGGAIPARPGWRTSCLIYNHAVTRRHGDEGLQHYGREGLQAAFNFEVSSMERYIAETLTRRILKQGIRIR